MGEEGIAGFARLRGKHSRLGQARTPQIATGNLRSTVRFQTCTDQKKTTNGEVGCFLLVGEEGIEPSRDCSHRILSPARLPIPPPAQDSESLSIQNDRDW